MTGQAILLDGHNRYAICQKHGIKFQTVEVEDLPDRDHTKIWIIRHQKGRRNISDDIRAVLENEERELLSEIEKRERAKKGREAGGDATLEQKKKRSEAKTSSKRSEPKERTRAAVAKKANLPERKLRLAQEIKAVDPHLSEMVQAATVTLVEAKKLSVLPDSAPAAAINATKRKVSFLMEEINEHSRLCCRSQDRQPGRLCGRR